MHPQPLVDDVGNRHARAERAVGVLEHDLHVVAERPHLAEFQAGDLLAQKADQALRGNQPQDGEPERGLAGAGFADDAERLALAHRDVDAVDRLDVADRLAQHAALDRKPDLEVVGLDHERRIRLQRRRIGLRLGRQQRAGIRMLRRGEDSLDRPLLDDLALLHHADGVGELAHDAEVVGDEQHRHAEPRLQVLEQLEDLRLHGDVERGGRLVGDRAGRARWRAPSRSSRAGAGRRRADADSSAAASPARECRPGSAVRACARAAAAPVMPWCSNRISPICFSIVCSGLSEVIGSWKMMVMSLPRTWRISLSESGSRSRPLNRIEPEGCCADGYGNSFITDSAVTDLPEPDSPTSATVSPLLISNEMRSTASVTRSPWRKATERSFTSRSFSAVASTTLTRTSCADRRRRAPLRR